MGRFKGSPYRTGERSTAKHPALDIKVQPIQTTLSHPFDQHLVSIPPTSTTEKRRRDDECIKSAIDLAPRSAWSARHWSSEYLQAAARLETAGGNYPALAAMASNFRARAAGMLQAVNA